MGWGGAGGVGGERGVRCWVEMTVHIFWKNYEMLLDTLCESTKSRKIQL